MSWLFVSRMKEVLRNLVKRYVAAMIRDAKTEEGLTEENFKVSTQIMSIYILYILTSHFPIGHIHQVDTVNTNSF